MDSAEAESVRTFGNDDTLPRLPLPDLEQTCERFIEWCEPLLTADELARTQSAVDEFIAADGTGRRLHAALERYAKTAGVHSWLDAFWADQYLGRRDPVAVNVNFFVLFKDDGQSQVARAAGLISAALCYKERLDEERVPAATRRGQPLSMDQYRYLFSTTRIPGRSRDTVRIPTTDDRPGSSPARHIVVLFRGNLFRLDVLDGDGHPYPADELAAGLTELMQSHPTAPDVAVGLLTSAPRSEWAAARQAMLGVDDGNARALDDVETALFCLSLEDLVPTDTLAACDQLLHGDGRNRWFDKTLTFVVFADGRAGLNAEHTCVDGTTALEVVDAILDGPLPAVRGVSPSSRSHPIAIEFVLDDSVRGHVSQAAQRFSALADTATAIVSIDGFGADDAKQSQISPDAFAQMAFQLAHWRVRGFLASTYESISMRHFRRGRTEALRVVTPEVVEFVTTMDDETASLATRRAAFRAAAASHGRRARECQTGQAPERHLAALRSLQQRQGAELGCAESIPLYASPGWLILRDEFLSTSTVSSSAAEVIGFGPTTPRCIGICYRVSSGRLSAYLSAPRAIADELREFATQLEGAVHEIAHLLHTETSAR